MSENNPYSRPIEVERDALKRQLVAAQAWIAAKCTIAGCWKSEYKAAQEKLQEMKRLTYDLHRRYGHPDSACLRCQLHDVIIDESS